MAEQEYNKAVKELLFKMADDQLIIGHRNSEWIGIGPVIEEDIAFGSLAQDKVGQASNLYSLLNELGEAEPDTLAFLREEKEFKCCHLVELPTGEYDFSLVRHFLFDQAEMIRFEMLAGSTFTPLANLAKKYKGEIKYHVFHANTWIKQLGKGTDESRSRMQAALNKAYPLALGIFEPGPFEKQLIENNIFGGEAALQKEWEQRINAILVLAGLQAPVVEDPKVAYGGRYGYHTEYLRPLLEEMGEVIRSEPGEEW